MSRQTILNECETRNVCTTLRLTEVKNDTVRQPLENKTGKEEDSNLSQITELKKKDKILTSTAKTPLPTAESKNI